MNYSDVGEPGQIVKLGERPPFGERVPNEVLSLFGSDRKLMLNGRQCENQGLGVGAFAYYRQLVERNRDSLLKAVWDAAVRAETGPEIIKVLDEAIANRRFTESLEAVRFPPSLTINGQNPLKLLPDVTSVGLHGLSDDECLQRAQSVRVILVEMVRKLRELLRDRAEVDEAVRHLMRLAPGNDDGGAERRGGSD